LAPAIAVPAVPAAVSLPVVRAGRVARVGQSGGCQMPLWGNVPPPRPALYCGDPVRLRPDSLPCSYCPTHAAVVFTTMAATRVHIASADAAARPAQAAREGLDVSP
jgi:hypothetical protein